MRVLVAILIVASGVGFALWFTKRQSKARETRAIAREEQSKANEPRSGRRGGNRGSNADSSVANRLSQLATKQVQELFEW